MGQIQNGGLNSSFVSIHSFKETEAGSSFRKIT